MYNKLFTKILDSSIWLEPVTSRIAWLTFIAAMDENGFVGFASIANLARRANITDQEAIEAVKILESPDSNSSDPDNEGRRIERIEGGWMVLNAEKYRDLVTRENIKEKTRARVAEFRKREKMKRTCNANVTPSEAYTVSNTESKEEKQGVTWSFKIPESLNNERFLVVWKDWIQFRRKKKACKDWNDLFKRQLEQLAEWGIDGAIASLKHSMLSDYQGIFEPKGKNIVKTIKPMRSIEGYIV